ncbi:MAG TPA: hypothetical protein VK035_01575 [Kiloniellales bacterium]|nr:hypothetical protein [Kiloniellales bacterium]
MLHIASRLSLIITLLALSLAFMTMAAKADFGDCTETSYLLQFDDRLSGTDFTCEERLREPVMTEQGMRHIRLLHDLHAGWALSPGALTDYERGIHGAVAALAQIGPFRMDDVTVLLIDGFPPREEGDGEGFSNIAGNTGASDDECRIAVHLLASSTAITEAALVVAHEIFHCVQFATLSSAQMSSSGAGTGSGGDWWLEGSAEWFAALAVSDREVLARRVASFDGLSADTPLYELAYSASVFFFWLGKERGPTGILPFLRRMANSSAAPAQRRAMRAALDADEWLAFAQAYLDQDIAYPDGSMLPSSPSEGDSWRWSETRVEAVTLDPFVLHRGWIEFDCGRWRTRGDPAHAHEVRSTSGAWGALPERLDTQAGDEARFRFAGLAARNATLTLRLTGDLETGCGSCGDLETTDTCIVGVWTQSGGGPIVWMQRELEGLEIPRGERRDVIEVFSSDGSFWTGELTADLTLEALDASKGGGEVRARSGGRWSAGEGRLNLCHDHVAVAGEITMTYPDGQSITGSVPTPVAPEVVTMGYSCTDSTLETRLSIPGVSTPMETQYRRSGDIAGAVP